MISDELRGEGALGASPRGEENFEPLWERQGGGQTRGLPLFPQGIK